MAAPTTAATNKPKRKPQGPRNAKPKEVYLLYKGEFTEIPTVELDGGAALVDRILADRDLKVQKVVIPVKSRKKTEAPTPEGGAPAATA